MMEAPTFVRTPDGVEITSEWPPAMIATREFIEDAERLWLQRKGRLLSFTLDNGSAVYRMVARGEYTSSYLLERVDR